MRKAISVSALILALVCSAYAGEMPNGSPEPPPAVTQEAQTADGDMLNGEPDSLADAVLSIVESVLALL